MFDPGMVGSPADVATLLVVLMLYKSRLQPRVATLSAAAVALARNHRDVDHERLQAALEVDDVDLNAVRPTVPDGGDLPSGLDAPTEADSARDGLLSYAGEWHALAVGAGAGLAAAATGTWVLVGVVATAALGLEVARVTGETPEAGKALGEVRKEPWYALGGLLAGVPVGLLVGSGLPI